MFNDTRVRLIMLAAFLSIASTAVASPILVTLDTSSLSGTQTLAFGLTNFDGAANTVSLSEFSLAPADVVQGSEDCTLGGTFSGLGCSGSLLSGVTLTDLDPVAAFFTQQFLPSASLSFVLSATGTASGGTPDQFAMYLCDVTVTACYSDDLTGALLLLDLVGGDVSPSSVAVFGAALQGLPAPLVTAVPAAVPEPGTLLLVGGGLIGSAMRRRWSARRRSGVSRARKLLYR